MFHVEPEIRVAWEGPETGIPGSGVSGDGGRKLYGYYNDRSLGVGDGAKQCVQFHGWRSGDDQGVK